MAVVLVVVLAEVVIVCMGTGVVVVLVVICVEAGGVLVLVVILVEAVVAGVVGIIGLSHFVLAIPVWYVP